MNWRAGGEFRSPQRGQGRKLNAPLDTVLLFPYPSQGESLKGRKPLTVEPAVLPQCLAGSMQWGDLLLTLPVPVRVAAGAVTDERKKPPPPPCFVWQRQLGWARVRASSTGGGGRECKRSHLFVHQASLFSDAIFVLFIDAIFCATSLLPSLLNSMTYQIVAS